MSRGEHIFQTEGRHRENLLWNIRMCMGKCGEKARANIQIILFLLDIFRIGFCGNRNLRLLCRHFSNHFEGIHNDYSFHEKRSYIPQKSSSMKSPFLYVIPYNLDLLWHFQQDKILLFILKKTTFCIYSIILGRIYFFMLVSFNK